MGDLSRRERLLRVTGSSVVILAFSYLLMPEITLGDRKDGAAIKRRVVIAQKWLLGTSKNTRGSASTSESYVRFTLKTAGADRGSRISIRVLGEEVGPSIELEDDKNGTHVSLGTLRNVPFLQAVRERGAKEQVGILLPGNDPTISADRAWSSLTLHVANGGLQPFASLSCSGTKPNQIYMSDDLPYIALAGLSGASRTFMSVRPQTGIAGLSFLDSSKRDRLIALVDPNGESFVVFFDRAGRLVRGVH